MIERNQVKTKKYGQWISTLFTVLLLAVLGISALFTILFGAKIYENISGRMDDNFNRSTALSYISNKVKQGDRVNSVEVKDIDGISTLIITEESESGNYVDMIYCLDGKLMELFTETSNQLDLGDGMEILSLDKADFSVSDKGVIEIVVEDGGKTGNLSLYVRSLQNGREVQAYE